MGRGGGWGERRRDLEWKNDQSEVLGMPSPEEKNPVNGGYIICYRKCSVKFVDST